MREDKRLYKKALRLYISYRKGKLTQEEYLACIKPLDNEIDKLEMEYFTDQVLKKASL